MPIRWANAALLVLLFASLGQTAAAPPRCPPNVAAMVWEATAGGETSFLVVLREQADLSGAADGAHVVERLRETARRTQAGLRAFLEREGVPYRAFYVVNALVVTGDRALVRTLAARPEVDRIAANPAVRAAPVPIPASQTVRSPSGIAWNVTQVNADDAWALGYTGDGVVVAGQDTGYDWDHPALVDQYRGWDGSTASHDYNWHDAIHTNSHGTNVCGADSPVPCDDNSHGTHTMGTIVGDDGGGTQIGVAPGAEWIGCRNMDNGYGTPATYIECFEFFIAPYPLGGTPDQGDPTRAPDVINNSWACPSYEGCDWQSLQAVVEAVRAAGILVVVSAGNYGSNCSTVNTPPAIYEAAFSVGATDSSDVIATFSSRGPVTVDGSYRRKPDVSAPGVSVYSCLPGGGYGVKSGTSMAAPHVAGVAALVWSAEPRLAGDVAATERLIEGTARPRTMSQACGGDLAGQVPNNVYGWGIVDALAAVNAALAVEPQVAVAKEARLHLATRTITYTLTVTNTGDISLPAVVLTDTLPANTTCVGASGSYTQAGGVVTWEAVALEPAASFTTTLTVSVGSLAWGGDVVNERYGARDGVVAVSASGTPVRTRMPWYIFLPLFRK